MKTLTSTLMATALSTLLAVPLLADDSVVPAQVTNEYSYQYEKTQGELTGDRLLQRDRDQQRLQTQTSDGSMTQDQLQTQDRVRSQLNTGSREAQGTQVKSMQRFEHSFTHSMTGNRSGGGGRH